VTPVSSHLQSLFPVICGSCILSITRPVSCFLWLLYPLTYKACILHFLWLLYPVTCKSCILSPVTYVASIHVCTVVCHLWGKHPCTVYSSLSPVEPVSGNLENLCPLTFEASIPVSYLVPVSCHLSSSLPSYVQVCGIYPHSRSSLYFFPNIIKYVRKFKISWQTFGRCHLPVYFKEDFMWYIFPNALKGNNSQMMGELN